MADKVQGATSIRRKGGSLGSCACIVQSTADPNRRYILSNAHVLAYDAVAPPAVGDEIFSDTSGSTPISKLDKWSRYLGPGDRDTDAAIAQIEPSINVTTEILDLGEPSHDPQVREFRGMRVHMRGGPGRIVSGTVVDSDHKQIQSMHIPALGHRQVTFVDQVLFKYDETQPALLFGFSGSAVLDDDKNLLGVFWMGSRNFGVYCKIANVFSEFGVQLASSHQARITLVAAGNAEIATETLAKTLWGEARGESQKGKEAVAAVVLNRAARRPRWWWGSTVETVCLKRFQFSCWNPNDPNRKELDTAPQQSTYPACLEVAQMAMDGALTDPTKGATHYHTNSIAPNWSAGHAPSAVIGGHRFYNSIE